MNNNYSVEKQQTLFEMQLILSEMSMAAYGISGAAGINNRCINQGNPREVCKKKARSSLNTYKQQMCPDDPNPENCKNIIDNAIRQMFTR